VLAASAGSHAHDVIGEVVPDIGTAPGQRPTLRAANKQSSSRAVKLVAGLAVIALLVIIGQTVFGGDGGDTATESELADPQREALVDEAAGESPDTASSGTAQAVPDTAGGGDPNFPPGDEHLAADGIAEVFQTRLNDLDNYAVAYHSEKGLQILSARGVSSPRVEVAVGFDQAARYPLFSDGDRTWAVNTLTPDLAYLVSTQFVVVDVGLEGSVAFVNNSLDPVNVGISSFGAWGPGFNVPRDAAILAIAGRGILIAPATGGSFRLTALGVEKISDDRVLAAGLNSQVFQRCDETLACELYVTNELNDGEYLLDVAASAQVFVSPSGRLVLSTEGSDALITNVETGEQWPLVLPAPATGAAWAPDGRFAAIIAGDSIVFAFDDQSQVDAALPVLPTSGSLLVLDS